MRTLSLLFLNLLITFSLFAQMPAAITIEPPGATAYDELTLIFDPHESCYWSGSLAGLDSIAIHSGVTYLNGNTWQDIINFDATGANGQSTILYPTGDGRFAITYNPYDFYGFPDGTVISQICAVFNNGTDWSNDGRDFNQFGSDCMDFYIPIHYPGDGKLFVPAEYPTIQAGIDASKDGETVIVAENTYYENIRFSGKAITVASEFILDGDSSHIVNTIIDGSQSADLDSLATVMFIDGEDTTSIIRGFTITGGSGVFEKENGIRSGGGVFSYNSGCKILDNYIQENHVESDSGGGAGIGCFMDEGDHWAVIKSNKIRNNTSSSDGFSAFGAGISSLSNSIIENNIIEYNSCSNTNSQTDGAGIEVEEWFVPGISCIIRDNIIRYNTLNGYQVSWGAGISIHFVSDVLLEGNIISENTCNGRSASWGGGIYARTSDEIKIIGNTIEKNECNSNSSNAGGGGINLLFCGKSTISENEINENVVFVTTGTNYWGGGILVDKATDTVFIQNNRIDNNKLANGNGNSGHGGGISFYCTNEIVVFVKANRITNNYSDYRGGGLCSRNLYRAFIQNNHFKENDCYRYGGAMMLFESNKSGSKEEKMHPVIANNTFVGNTADYGGAIYSRVDSEVPVIFNSIFCNNTAENSPDLYHFGVNELVVYNNLIDTSAIVTPWTGSENINCNPGLQSDSLHLDYPSLCLNAGTESLSFDGNWFYSPNADIDGETRPYEDTKPDIGADEAPWLWVGNPGNITLNDPSVICYPNPFTTTTTIEYEINQPETVIITFYNQFGKQVDAIAGRQQKGVNKVIWNPGNLADGIYYFRLKAGEQIARGKIVLVM